MPAAIVSYFRKLCAKNSSRNGQARDFMRQDPMGAGLLAVKVFLMIAIVFVGMVVHPAGPEIY